MNRTPYTPLQLVRYTLLGCALLAFSYAISFSPFPNPVEGHGFLTLLWSARSEIAFTAVPFVAGGFLAWRSFSSLGTGIRTERWNELEIETARTFLASPLFTWIILATIPISLAIVVSMIVSHRHGSFAYVLIWAAFPIGWMRQTLRKYAGPAASVDWRDTPPVHSSHWGRPPAGV